MEYEEINGPLYNGLGALIILEDETWYIWTVVTTKMDSSSMMISLQQTNYLYKSSIIINCVKADDVRKVCYISPNSTCAMTGSL